MEGKYMDKRIKKAGRSDETLELKPERRTMFEIDHEVPEKRKANSKVFRTKDGKYVTAVYPHSIHRLNNDTLVYEDVDNTLKETEDGLETVNGLCRVRLPGERSRRKAISVSSADGKYSVSWEYLASNPRKAVEGRKAKKLNAPELSRKKIKQKKEEMLTSLEKEHPAAKFKEAAPGVDIEYELENSRLKENIIINRKKQKYQFLFRLKAENLTARIEKNHRSIGLYAEVTGEDGTVSEKKVFRIPGPIMTDAAGTYSGDVIYTFDREENGRYLFKVIANPKWINAIDRKFPVTIDPILDYVLDGSGYVRGSLTYQDDEMETLVIGYNQNGDSYVSNITTVLPELPDGAYVEGAYLTMKQDIVVGNSIGLKAVDENCRLTGFTLAENCGNGEYSTFNLSNAVRKAYSSGSTSFGLTFAPIIKNEEINPGDDCCCPPEGGDGGSGDPGEGGGDKCPECLGDTGGGDDGGDDGGGDDGGGDDGGGDDGGGCNSMASNIVFSMGLLPSMFGYFSASCCPDDGGGDDGGDPGEEGGDDPGGECPGD